jgi:hypothetical protein
VRATAGGLTAAASFSATQPLPAVRLEKVSGDNAVCLTRSTNCTFVVRAVDVNGVPVPGASITWSTPNGCAAPNVTITDGFGLATAPILCATLPAGDYTQIATLNTNQQQISFAFGLRGVILTFESVDNNGVSTYAVTASAPASGLSVKVDYRSGPAANYVTLLDLNRTVTPAVLLVGYDASELPFGDYTFDVIVSTTTPGLGPGVATIMFNPSTSSFKQPNARRQPTSRRVPVASRAP